MAGTKVWHRYLQTGTSVHVVLLEAGIDCKMHGVEVTMRGGSGHPEGVLEGPVGRQSAAAASFSSSALHCDGVGLAETTEIDEEMLIW